MMSTNHIKMIPKTLLLGGVRGGSIMKTSFLNGLIGKNFGF